VCLQKVLTAQQFDQVTEDYYRYQVKCQVDLGLIHA
jgi:hypothetical protein